ncbi:helix-turn-helix domain-containing protein [Bacillus cereus]|nr:helix-turn-helix domain-containing protein [Bacillus cereus]
MSHIAKENGITRQTVYRIKNATSNSDSYMEV